MRLMVVSALRWRTHPAAVQSLVARLIGAESYTCVVLDALAIERETVAACQNGFPPCSHIAFADWLKPGAMEDSVIDAHLIREAPAGLPIDRPIVLDCSGHRAELIVAALRECRYAWYPLDQWHPAFALVCDDIALLPMADALANTFYCQPVNLGDRNLRNLVNDHFARAFVFRWFGYTTGRRTVVFVVALRRFRLWVQEKIRGL